MLCWQEMKRRRECCITDGQGTHFSAILGPSDRSLGRNASEPQSSTSMWVTGLTDKLKTTCIGY